MNPVESAEPGGTIEVVELTSVWLLCSDGTPTAVFADRAAADTYALENDVPYPTFIEMDILD